MRLRKLIPTEAKLQVYKTAIFPHLMYCSLVWHFCTASDRKKLERVNESLRAVFCNWNLSYNDLLKRANFTTLYNKDLQDIAIFNVFKVTLKLLPKNILDLFSRTPCNHYPINSDFFIPCFNSVRHEKHSLKFFGPRLWSKLSPGDRERQTLTAFMASIRKRVRE